MTKINWGKDSKNLLNILKLSAKSKKELGLFLDKLDEYKKLKFSTDKMKEIWDYEFEKLSPETRKYIEYVKKSRKQGE